MVCLFGIIMIVLLVLLSSEQRTILHQAIQRHLRW